MDFKIGYSVRPKEITTFNRVVFEEYKIVEGKEILVEVLPTEDDCIGYHFNYYSKNCWTLSENQFIDIDGVYDYGSNNSKSFNNTNSIILGSDNNLSQGGANDLIVGDYNNIDLNTRNSIVFGTKGEASATNSIVLGGNSNNDILGERQTIKLMYGGTTTNDSSTPLYLNNILDKYFNIPINTAMTFSSDILALRVGGSSKVGIIGDYASWIERGVIVNKNGVISVSTTNTPIVSSGTTTGWMPSSNIPTSSELVTNGNFTTNLSSWTINNSDRSNSITWSKNGALFILPNTSPVTVFSSGARTIVGKSYNLVVVVSDYVSGGIKIDGGGVSELFNSSGTFTRVITPSSTAPISFYRATKNVNLTVRSVSLKEIIAPIGSTYNINVVGARDTNIEWASTINFTQIKTNVTL